MKNGAKWVNRTLAVIFASVEYRKNIAYFPTYTVAQACEYVICTRPDYWMYIKNPEALSDKAYERFIADVRKHLASLSALIDGGEGSKQS